MELSKLVETLLNETTTWLPKLAAVMLIVVLFYILAKIIRRVILKVSSRFNVDPYLVKFFAQTSRILITLFGVVTALGTVGIDISALVAGLGLTGFALGFALKDTISNILSGVMILLYRPFIVGNNIKVAGFEGKVIAIDLRYTRLNSEEGTVLIPNAKIFTDPVVVYTEENQEV